ncbi:MAG: thermostable hemolysin [Porticoccus sp.]
MTSTHSVDITSCSNNNSGYRRLNRLLSPGPELKLNGINCHARTEMEHYIAKQFQAVYGASVKDFLPFFLGLRCNNKLSAVTGICPASTNVLFIEQYLDNPIEDEINHFSAQHVQRSAIAEIGNLAATQRGSSQLLFILLAATLHQANIEWLAFTATPQVQKTIGKLGFQLQPIKEASPLCLNQSSLQGWGNYYDTKPMVVAGRIDEAMDTINDRQVLKGMLSLYKNRIDALASVISNQNSNDNHAQYYFAA